MSFLDPNRPVTARVLSRIDEVTAEAWDACAGDDNPFVSHAFLHALEESGSVTADTGWLPQHLVIEQDGRIIGCVPVYLKGHSYGEYVFDWGWAEAYERAGGNYYPKLQCCVPFTPVTGPRLLTHPLADGRLVRATLVRALLNLAKEHKVSSVHVTFPTKQEWEEMGEIGLLQRIGLQYHWDNQGYADFDGFLDALSSRKRKAIKKERRKVAESGVDLRTICGAELSATHWDAFYRFYRDTSDRKWGQAYLTREFFARLGETMADQVVLVTGTQDEEIVCGALNLRGRDTLYGRNWGCEDHVKFLHFEACYYQAIDYAIAHGLKRVEAGAQGEHKIQRGYVPNETYSAHWIASTGLRDAVADFLARETLGLRQEMRGLSAFSPYKTET